MNNRLQRLDWFAVRPAKPCCADEKDFLKANVMRTCSAPADSPLAVRAAVGASWRPGVLADRSNFGSLYARDLEVAVVSALFLRRCLLFARHCWCHIENVGLVFELIAFPHES